MELMDKEMNFLREKLFTKINLELIEKTKLNLAIRRINWWVVLIATFLSMVGVSISIIVNQRISITDLLNHLILPTLSVMVVQIFIWFLCIKVNKWADYFVLIGTFLTVNTYIFFYPEVIGLYTILVLCIVLSTIYFEYEKVYFTSFLCLAASLAYLLLFRPISQFITVKDILACIGIYSAAVFISIVVIKRGKYLLSHLERSNKNQEDLLIRNILMDRASKIDPLTDLYNHKTFHQYLEGLIEQGETNGLPLQLAIIDIDNFKKVNDQYGHWIGDLILKRVGEQIKDHISLNDFASRYGGEEFAVIFTDRSEQESFEVLEYFRKSVSSVGHVELDNKSITVSIGMCSYVKGLGKDSFFITADECLYKAKNNGKNQTVIADSDAINHKKTS